MGIRLYTPLSFLLILCLCALLPHRAMAVACSDIFTNGIQAHAANGNIKFNYHSSITGGSATLTTKTLTDNSSWAACSGSNCVATGTAALTSAPAFVTGNGANGAVNVVYQGTASIAAGNYTTVNVEQEGKLTFSSASGSYKTGAMVTKLRSILELQSGDYWINGNLTVGQETQLRRIATSGTTRIFVNGNVTFGYKASTSGFASNQLLIYATGSITSDNETILSAYLYAGGNISLDYRVTINGAVSGANFIGNGNEVTINYQGSNLSSAEFSPFCTSVAPPVICPAGISSGITGKYYNNRLLTEPATASRSDAPIDFAWGAAAPGPSGVTADNFSTQWSGYVRATQSGNYRFQTVSDDGVRLYVNGNLVINRWTDHSATTDTTADIPLVAGQAYTIVLEYYENGGDATIRLQWLLPGASSYVAIPGGPTPTLGAGLYECTPVAKPPVSSCSTNLSAGITGSYFNNQTVATPVTATRLDGPINFDWGAGVPGPAGVNDNNFSVSWNGYIYVTQTGVHRFQTHSDDGVRLTVNGDLLIDQWNDHSATTHTSAAVNFEAGKAYPIKLEFYDNTAVAVMQLRWQTPGGTTYTAIPIGVNASPVTSTGLYECVTTPAAYSISNNPAGLTCAAEQVTVTALNAAGVAYSPPVGTKVTLTTNPATGVWVGSNLNTYTYTFLGGENNFFTYLQQTTPATLVINATSTTATGSSSITFADVGLKIAANFSQNPPATPPPVVNQIAGVPGTARLKVIRKDDNTGACVAQVGVGTRPVSLAYTCVDPTTCIPGQAFTVNGNGITANNNGAGPAYSAVNLTFDNNGEAPLTINYSDVGQVRLSAQLSLLAVGNNPAITLTGGSDLFVVKPQSIVVSGVQRLNGTSNPGGTSASGTAAQFVAAGEQFKVLVEARNGATPAALTPNFGRENTPETKNLKIKTQSLVYPASGTATDLTIAGAIASTTPQGTFVYGDVRWNQVGSILIAPHFDDGSSATTDDGDYLGAGNIPNLVASTTVGRFYPDKFDLTNTDAITTCSGFLYMGMPFNVDSIAPGTRGLDFLLRALDTSGNPVTNYDASKGYAVASTPFFLFNTGNNFLTRLKNNSVAINAPAWVNGIVTISEPNAQFSRVGVPDGSYAAVKLGIGVQDCLDKRSLSGANLTVDTTGGCGALNNNAYELAMFNARYGRLRLDDAFGPETADLPVNFATEYWAGTYFTQNADDSCTKILRSAIRYPAGNILTPANLTVQLTGGTTTGSYSSASAIEINFTSGDARHFFTAPTGNATGNFPVEVDLTSYPWLRFDWDQNGSYDDASLPTARFGFGSYRGHDRVIYWRERLN